MNDTTESIIMIAKELAANWQLPIACGLRFTRVPTIITPKGKVTEFISLIKPDHLSSQLGTNRPGSQTEPDSCLFPMGTIILETYTTLELLNTLDIIWPVFKAQHIEGGIVSYLPIFVTDLSDIEDPEKRLFFINLNTEFSCLYEQPISAVIHKKSALPTLQGDFYDMPMQLRKPSCIQMYQILCWAAHSLFCEHRRTELFMECIDLAYYIVEADATLHGWLESETPR